MRNGTILGLFLGSILYPSTTHLQVFGKFRTISWEDVLGTPSLNSQRMIRLAKTAMKKPGVLLMLVRNGRVRF